MARSFQYAAATVTSSNVPSVQSHEYQQAANVSSYVNGRVCELYIKELQNCCRNECFRAVSQMFPLRVFSSFPPVPYSLAFLEEIIGTVHQEELSKLSSCLSFPHDHDSVARLQLSPHCLADSICFFQSASYGC